MQKAERDFAAMCYQTVEGALRAGCHAVADDAFSQDFTVLGRDQIEAPAGNWVLLGQGCSVFVTATVKVPGEADLTDEEIIEDRTDKDARIGELEDQVAAFKRTNAMLRETIDQLTQANGKLKLEWHLQLKSNDDLRDALSRYSEALTKARGN